MTNFSPPPTFDSGGAAAPLVTSVDTPMLHATPHSFEHQISHLLAAEFFELLVGGVAKSLLQKVKNRAGKEGAQTQSQTVRPLIMPYMHKVSHN